MNMAVFELNDAELKIGKNNETLYTAPGYAYIKSNQAIFGEQAKQQARLHPLQTFNHYWNRLNLDGIQSENIQFRHNADLVYAQLQSMLQQANGGNDFIFAVPANLSRDQLAMLLGILQQTSVNIRGLIDLATASVASRPLPGQHLHIDLQLHQTVISQVNVGEQISREKVEIINNAGYIALWDAWARAITEQFIQDTRFDPLHNAATEQELYDQLQEFYTLSKTENEFTATIHRKQANISSRQLENYSQPVIDAILNKIHQHSIDGKVFIHDRLNYFDQLVKQTKNAESVSKTAVLKACSDYEAYITKNGEDITFTTKLPNTSPTVLNEYSPEISSKDSSNVLATHILLDSAAYQVTDNPLPVNLTNKRLSIGGSTNTVCSFIKKNNDIIVICNDEQGLLINDTPHSDRHTIYSGDVIRLPGLQQTLVAIHVKEH